MDGFSFSGGCFRDHGSGSGSRLSLCVSPKAPGSGTCQSLAPCAQMNVSFLNHSVSDTPIQQRKTERASVLSVLTSLPLHFGQTGKSACPTHTVLPLNLSVFVKVPTALPSPTPHPFHADPVAKFFPKQPTPWPPGGWGMISTGFLQHRGLRLVCYKQAHSLSKALLISTRCRDQGFDISQVMTGWWHFFYFPSLGF